MKAIVFTVTAALALSACASGPAAWADPQARSQTQGASQEQQQLDQARHNYQKAVSELAQSLNVDLRAVEAHRADLGVILMDFSDEEVRLRQRFGDGDRIGTWPAMRRLSLAWHARSPPQQRLLAGARARSDAVLYSVMVSAGDAGATNGELLALWDEAAALDPLAFEAHMGTHRAALAFGSRGRACNAAYMALSAARMPAEQDEANTALDRARCAPQVAR